MPSEKESVLMQSVRRMNAPTTAAEYKSAREARGTQAEVAEALGINRVTLAKRESGAQGWPISMEAALAMLALPVKKKGTK